MRSFLSVLLLSCVCASASATTPAAAPPAATPASRAEAAFARLSALVGRWKGRFHNGREHEVTYRLTAGGTVLMETWALSPTRESLTLYHLDGDALVATHYCPQGTQPRLQLATGGDHDRLSFEFRDGTSLQSSERSHQHSFWIELRDDDTYLRSETYVQNGSSAEQIAAAEADPPVTYTRVAAAVVAPH